MRNNSSLNWLAAVVVLGSILAIWFFTFPGLSNRDARIHTEIGRALAQEAIKLAGPKAKFTLLLRDPEAFPQPATSRALQGFHQELIQAGRGEASLQALQVDPLRPVQVPGGDFQELIRKGAPGDVIVSLMGPPILTEEKRAALGIVKPKIVAFCPGGIAEQVDLRLLHDQGLLHAAIISRLSTGPGALTPSARHDVFDDIYLRASTADLANRASISSRP